MKIITDPHSHSKYSRPVLRPMLSLLTFLCVFALPLVAAQVQTYDQLVTAIRQARTASRARVEQAVRQEKVREAWETGKLIDEHVLRHKERADYGKRVISRLAKDLATSETELYYMLQFARTYPNFRSTGKLSWTQYQTLLSVNDPAERAELEEKAARENWTQDQTRDEVRKHKALKSGTGPASESGPVPLVSAPGKVGTYRIVKATVGPEIGKVVIDLGFSNYYKTSRDLRFEKGTIVEVIPAISAERSAPSDKIKLSKRTFADLFTYRAYVVNVLDGDTVKAVIDLGFGVRSVQTLRLRGLDCPELVSKEGKEAKAFIEKALQIPGNGERGTQAQAEPVIAPVRQGISGGSPSGTKQSQPFVLIRTTKSDKYDRYLVDIWAGDTYVNQELLTKGFAVRMEE